MMGNLSVTSTLVHRSKSLRANRNVWVGKSGWKVMRERANQYLAIIHSIVSRWHPFFG